MVSKNLTIKANEKIPGIFNYCDRWCARCPLTSRCEIFVAADNAKPIETTLEEVHRNFQKTLDLLKQWADQNNVTLEDLQKNTDAYKSRREKNLHNARTNDTSKLANDYRLAVLDFNNKNKLRFEAAKKMFADRSSLALAQDKKDLQEIVSAFETIGWYELQMPVKITRAYTSLADSTENAVDPVQNDYNGSAKVVLIGIENSFPAWEIVMKHFPELEMECWSFLVLLDKIRKRILADFPLVNSFVRPGFDEQLIA